MARLRKTAKGPSKKGQKVKQTKGPKKTWMKAVPKPSRPDIEIMGFPALSDIKPPDGFRVVSYTQAMMEYAKPVLENSESQDMKELNERLQLATTLWNYSIPKERITGPRPAEKDVITRIKKSLSLSDHEAKDFFPIMITRKATLFPEDFQQKGVPFMIMRKEVSNLITRFDLGRLNLSDKAIPPDRDDKKFISTINQLDSYILKSAEYDEYDDLLNSLQDQCTQTFGRWLISGIRQRLGTKSAEWSPRSSGTMENCSQGSGSL